MRHQLTDDLFAVHQPQQAALLLREVRRGHFRQVGLLVLGGPAPGTVLTRGHAAGRTKKISVFRVDFESRLFLVSQDPSQSLIAAFAIFSNFMTALLIAINTVDSGIATFVVIELIFLGLIYCVILFYKSNPERINSMIGGCIRSGWGLGLGF